LKLFIGFFSDFALSGISHWILQLQPLGHDSPLI
jgi:hypothetical protein